MSNLVRLKLLCLISVLFSISAIPAFSAESSSEQQFSFETEVSNEALWGNQSFELFAESDNFFRRLFGVSRRTNVKPNSRSQRHSTSRPRRYSPPASNSQNPDTYEGKSRSLPSSDGNSVRNTPKPPLERSRRDQYQSLGVWELGLMIGTSHAISDIGGNKGIPVGDFAEYHTTNFSLGGGLYGRYIMNDWFAMNLGMGFANLNAEREFAPEGSEVFRFNNDIFEFYVKSEFRLPALARSPFDLYGFVGIGIFFSDASIYDINDRLISTQDDYSQVQPVIPFGGGFSVKITDSFRIGYELGWRNTIFHYLDGVKKDETYDHYFLNSIKIGFIF
ncbi:MAG: hypothetical protein EA361_13615 [Bacteroidetes bacterium]|nr:MAG: hypothetical protein EA361_13615 [Bacteroidota bacterium]